MFATLFGISLLYLFFASGCCSTKDTITSNTTQTDTTLHPNTIGGTLTQPDNNDAVIQWYQDELTRVYIENDSLKGLPPDTVKIKEIIESKPFTKEWKDSLITPNGDSVKLSHKLENGKSTFHYKIVPAPVKATLTNTTTTIVKEKQLAWYEKFWQWIKDVGLIISLGLNVLLLVFIFFQKIKSKLSL